MTVNSPLKESSLILLGLALRKDQTLPAAFQNIVKHASARVVRVHLVSEGDKVELVIDDDGIGFDSDADHPGHLGLSGMKQRATAQNLQLTVHSPTGGGVEVRVRTHALPRRTKHVIPWS